MESGMEKKTIKKNDIYTIEIEDLSTDGSGIGKIDGIVIAVRNADKQQKMRQTADNIHRFPA